MTSPFSKLATPDPGAADTKLILEFWRAGAAEAASFAVACWKPAIGRYSGFFCPGSESPPEYRIDGSCNSAVNAAGRIISFQNRASRPFSAYWRIIDGPHRIIFLDDITSPTTFYGFRHVILETSPGNYQVWLMLDGPPPNSETRLAIQRRVGAEYNSDPGAGGLVRWARMPGSINRKPGRENFVTRLVSAQMDGEFMPTPLNITPPRRQQGRGGVETRAHGHSKNNVRPWSAPVDVMALIANSPVGCDGTKSTADMRGVMSALSRGVNEATVYQALKTLSDARGKHPDYARLTVAKAIKYIRGES